VIYTSRNVRTFVGNLGKISAHTLPIIIDWLRRYQVPYDEIYVGKPWCGHEGFYVDDKAIRPKEFLENSHEQIMHLLNNKK
jgi:capsule biosynthesis phosphatase